jgi:hypothetical protein
MWIKIDHGIDRMVRGSLINKLALEKAAEKNRVKKDGMGGSKKE